MIKEQRWNEAYELYLKKYAINKKSLGDLNPIVGVSDKRQFQRQIRTMIDIAQENGQKPTSIMRYASSLAKSQTLGEHTAKSARAVVNILKKVGVEGYNYKEIRQSWLQALRGTDKMKFDAAIKERADLLKELNPLISSQEIAFDIGAYFFGSL